MGHVHFCEFHVQYVACHVVQYVARHHTQYRTVWEPCQGLLWDNFDVFLAWSYVVDNAGLKGHFGVKGGAIWVEMGRFALYVCAIR